MSNRKFLGNGEENSIFEFENIFNWKCVFVDANYLKPTYN